jgi:type I restriction enzyme S subunit
MIESPSGWIVSKLGTCCSIVSGGTPKRERPEYWGGSIPWVTPKDISDLDCPEFYEPPEKITELGLRKSSAALLPAGTVLLSSRAPIGLLAIAGEPMATNQGFKSLIPGPELDSRFLYYALKRLVPLIQERGNGATFKEVSKSVVSEIPISYPRSLQQQKRIAAILDKADGIRRKQESALAMADELLRSVFLEMFGDPRLNNYGLKEIPLGKLMQKITDGEHQNPTFAPEGMPIVMANQVLLDRIKIDETKFVSFEDGERFRKKCGPAHNDILIVGRGATIGRCCLVNTEIKFCLMGSVILLKPNRDVVSPFYLLSFLQHPAIQQQLVQTSSSSAQQAIYLSHLKQMPVPVPEYTKQKKYENIANRVLETRSRIQQGANEAELFFRALSQFAFRGKL